LNLGEYDIEIEKLTELDQETWFLGLSLFSNKGIALANHSGAHRLLRS